jgi:hypothetical protein
MPSKDSVQTWKRYEIIACLSAVIWLPIAVYLSIRLFIYIGEFYVPYVGPGLGGTFAYFVVCGIWLLALLGYLNIKHQAEKRSKEW